MSARDERLSPTAAALRDHFARHNRRVAVLVALTLFLATGLWFISYAIVYWLTLLFLSAAHGLEARPPDTFPVLFIYSAALLIIVSWIARAIFPNDTARDDKSLFEIAADFLLAVPRATLAIWGNLSAWQRLTDDELELAAGLVKLLRDEPRLPLQSLPVELPDRASRRKILLALQLSQVIKIRRTNSVTWLSLTRAVLEGRALAERK